MELQGQKVESQLKKTQIVDGDIFLKSGRTELVKKYGSYVQGIARKIKRTLSSQIEYDDLVSYGMKGLFEAAERFDPTRGANFTTFSYYRIRGAIYDGLRGMGWVNRSEYQKIRFEERANQYLETKANERLHRPGSIGRKQEDEINELGQQVSHLVTIFITSMENIAEDELEDKQTQKQDSLVEEKQMQALLGTALQKLPEKDRKLIELYYFKAMSLEEVGKQLGLSKSWTCRKHATVIEHLGKIMRQLLKGDFP